MQNAIIAATGCYIPPTVIPNDYFRNHEFYDAEGLKLERPNPEIIKKLHEITGIKERRYIGDDLTTSDIAYFAAEKALEGIDRESLDYIIVASVSRDLDLPGQSSDALKIIPGHARVLLEKFIIRGPWDRSCGPSFAVGCSDVC